MVSLKGLLNSDPSLYVWGREKLPLLVGKTIESVTDVGEWQGDVYGFQLNFTDKSSVEFSVTNSESISVEIKESTNG